MDCHKNKKYSGILLLDKPKGVSSNCILQLVKKIFCTKKAGYTGSLDPLATGMLPILFGKATKFSRYLTDSIKEYHVIAKLGESTITGDSSGKILKSKAVHISTNHVINILKTFIGTIKQIPPMFSAIKYSGVPLYKYARLGITIPRRKRKLIIYKLNFIQLINFFLEFTVICSKGTYIRSLVDDIGEKLQCGAHVVYLRRVTVGPYCASKLVTFSSLCLLVNKNMQQLNTRCMYTMLNTFLLPISSIFSKYPQIKLSDIDANNFQKNLSILLINFFKTGLVTVVTKKYNIFLGIGKINQSGFLIPKRILF